jgi:hypothetical protein
MSKFDSGEGRGRRGARSGMQLELLHDEECQVMKKKYYDPNLRMMSIYGW